MFSDNTLLPKEAVRLAVLGTLTAGAKSYGDVVTEVQHFVSRIAGPSLELMGVSVEMLRHEGLVEHLDKDDDGRVQLTGAGRGEFLELLSSSIRPPLNDVNKLILALKMRYLHVLDAQGQRDQIDMMIEACRTELARLVDLRGHHAGEDGDLVTWLDHDIDLVEIRLQWLEDFRAGLQGAS